MDIIVLDHTFRGRYFENINLDWNKNCSPLKSFREQLYTSN
ncbi:hypothetical protein [Flavobacterium aquicola]|uniref:Uncharacterized protein n=1 Tax=Flavobacterium aquicola TaxID=1682742 RepID=A0A3E0ETU7_9FLAO|nr:hypothetical protein [Flavobacterium aquicola]REH01655.1 hypothetical protein C8P67_101134 [Flavobacterium aquicola]